jgi:hypothetical protein
LYFPASALFVESGTHRIEQNGKDSNSLARYYYSTLKDSLAVTYWIYLPRFTGCVFCTIRARSRQPCRSSNIRLRNKEVDIAIYKLTNIDMVFRDGKVVGSFTRKLIYQSDHQLLISELINNAIYVCSGIAGTGVDFPPPVEVKYCSKSNKTALREKERFMLLIQKCPINPLNTPFGV